VYKLVVVGDQSAGKSSVLQAITEVSFPVKDGTCTRFPIQISFCQTSAARELPVKATIVPGRQSENDGALIARIRDFAVERKELTTDVIKEIIEKVCLASWMVGRSLIARQSRQQNVFLARISGERG
jgi:GTPase SAR1 family protein